MANEVMAKKDTGSIALFGNDAAKGFENMTQEDMALPFVRILGQLSPQVTDGDAKFIESQAFAYLGIRRVKNLPISFPGTTGVKNPITGGKITKLSIF